MWPENIISSWNLSELYPNHTNANICKNCSQPFAINMLLVTARLCTWGLRHSNRSIYRWGRQLDGLHNVHGEKDMFIEVSRHYQRNRIGKTSLTWCSFTCTREHMLEKFQSSVPLKAQGPEKPAKYSRFKQPFCLIAILLSPVAPEFMQ